MSGTNWEYKVVELNAKTRGIFSSKIDNQLIEQQLNDLGRQGWELLDCNIGQPSAFSAIANYAVFKRGR